MSQETVHITLTVATLNNLQGKCGDVLNAYIATPTTTIIWIILGDEFGPDQGRTSIIIRMLCGLKSGGAAFVGYLGGCMSSLNYKPCLADPDLWLKTKVRENCFDYYLYILVYVANILVVNQNAKFELDCTKGYKCKLVNHTELTDVNGNLISHFIAWDVTTIIEHLYNPRINRAPHLIVMDCAHTPGDMGGGKTGHAI